MFQGYFGRRFKTLLISYFISCVIFIFVYFRKNICIFNQKYSIKIGSSVLLSSSPVSVLSSIEFLNSHYLNLEYQSNNIIPIIVLSKASNLEIRDAIRRTWAFNQFYKNNTIQIKVFFLVGTNDYTIKYIRAEQMIFSDVIHVSLPEMHSFTAYKELSAMIWVRLNLPNAPFYIKTEEDIILNPQAIINKLFPIIKHIQNKKFIIGWFGVEHSIKRNTYQKFINAIFPPSFVDFYYAMSLLYVITSQASDRMIDTLNHIDFIQHPGDIFLTGILRDAANIRIKNLAVSNVNYSYLISNGTCKKEFEKDPELLLCTTSSYIRSSYSILEYFEAWNVFLS